MLRLRGKDQSGRRLEWPIRKNRLQDQSSCSGTLHSGRWMRCTGRADVVVLTSRSEGIPLVLMEAMARGRIVLAPAITGIPEIVIPGKTGFLYAPGALQDFVAKILFLQRSMCAGGSSAVSRLDWVRHAARDAGAAQL